jgi:hypothetical protein
LDTLAREEGPPPKSENDIAKNQQQKKTGLRDESFGFVSFGAFAKITNEINDKGHD